MNRSYTCATKELKVLTKIRLRNNPMSVAAGNLAVNRYGWEIKKSLADNTFVVRRSGPAFPWQGRRLVFATAELAVEYVREQIDHHRADIKLYAAVRAMGRVLPPSLKVHPNIPWVDLSLSDLQKEQAFWVRLQTNGCALSLCKMAEIYVRNIQAVMRFREEGQHAERR